MKENKASITIDAAPSDVWSVLTDLDNYHDWNPFFVSAKGKIAEGESLQMKMKMPVQMFCGAPLSYSWSPRITKVEPYSYLEWFAPAGLKGFIDGTHYFQLTSTNGGTVTEFTQGERYTGWGTGLYTGFGTMEDARRGFVAMNNALQMETLRRKQQGSGNLAEKTESHSDSGVKGTHQNQEENDVAQLDISDRAAVAAVSSVASNVPAPAAAPDASSHKKDLSVSAISEKELTGSMTAFTEGVQDVSVSSSSAPAIAEKPLEKRTSIIGAVSSLFSSSKSPSIERLPQSASKDDLICKAVVEEHLEEADHHDGEDGDNDNNQDDDDDYDTNDYLHEIEDPEAKRAREAKNAERIELDLGSGDLSLGEFGI
ncbi:hypothetical protein FBU30_005402 [Linnemannia zychae]|nr:hypothetical protein FBU30_005402 [Linnemannia zychae]